MTQTITPKEIDNDKTTIINVHGEPIVIPEKHQQDLGPVSDVSPDTWRYNPETITKYYQKRPFQVLARLFNILFPFIDILFNNWWDSFWGNSTKNETKRAIKLRKVLTKLGPAYIKIGQALSTRPDLVSPAYLEELTQLQDQLPPFSNDIAYQFIEEELGATPDEIYAEISPQPIAAASLGQVYRGRLKTGEEVAIKVQRPDLVRRITLDVYIMRTLSTWVKNNVKRIRSDLVAITDELAERIFEEMNYLQEGENATKFDDLYGHLPEIYVPKIYWEYTGRRVLTMEWINGTKLTNIKEIQAQGIDATHLVEVGVQCSLRQLLEHGFFHADPHPGNLLAMPDGRLAYLDFGMMSTILPYQRYGLIEAVVHLVNRDFESLAQDYVKLDFLTPETDLTPIIPALSNVFNNALGASVAELNFKKITDEMSAMMYEFPFRVPAYYALIIRSMVTLEGIAINIDPNFKVLSKAYPYVAKRLLTDQSQELRNSLKDLLFKDGSFRWNRLENLLNNAKDSPDYDFDKVVNQGVDFLFSDRGSFIRETLADEIINFLDNFGQETWFNISSTFRKTIGLKPLNYPLNNGNGKGSIDNNSMVHITNVLQILQETEGYDPLKLIPIITNIIQNSETQKLGQKIAGGLAQKATARLIRNILLDSNNTNNRNDRNGFPSNLPLSLPSALK
ncbi:MAG: AarF/ABC1/UbiB kinase family protein [Cyanobacteria bacterium]|nr:AarF/ABC1/UbiB kinase family protein [Cyanobacteria bacterium CG_2015-16_32_12]NCO78003.1 AarF/ABC1/UbiB kinase family protein [Cyanobacteria bacterium CG_2015-22_32_23]NCQ43168.1 AarF/ABC1/UbiB kinase family protein [Cyanobacteria bacterium CG_2015-04_32_10]NCS85505.1 AarF/ABC1/UbiB kinase family protein [Cyanobacteria bacterium CG_2015-02_32_10]